MTLLIRIAPIIISLIGITKVQAQNVEVYKLLSNHISLENTTLFNGVESRDYVRTINEKNKYFNTAKLFNNGSIQYDNDYYPDVLLKFNVYDDLVRIKIPAENRTFDFELITSKVQKFEIAEHQFENVGLRSNKFDGFYESMLENSFFTLLKKHQKRKKERKNEKFLYYEFSPISSHYIIDYKEDFYPVNKKREIAILFPSMKAGINDFYRIQKKLYKSDYDNFQVQLFNYIASQLKLQK